MGELGTPYQSGKRDIQEIVYYCASRLRASLVAMAIEDDPRIVTWKKEIYIKELVFQLNGKFNNI